MWSLSQGHPDWGCWLLSSSAASGQENPDYHASCVSRSLRVGWTTPRSELTEEWVRDGALFFSQKLPVQIFYGIQKELFLLFVFLLSEGLPLYNCDATHIIPWVKSPHSAYQNICNPVVLLPLVSVVNLQILLIFASFSWKAQWV